MKYYVGGEPNSVAVGDFNGDSNPDVAMVNYGFRGVSILLGDGRGSFGAPTRYEVGTHSVAVGDFNGDSDPDLAVLDYGSVSVLLGGPGGSFGAATSFEVGGASGGLVIGDFNGDSDPDLVVPSTDSMGSVEVLLGGAGGSFGAPIVVPVPGFYPPVDVAVGDFNGDSDSDLAVSLTHGSLSAGSVAVLLGGAGASFGEPTEFNVARGIGPLAVGDFNGDSDPDLAVGSSHWSYGPTGSPVTVVFAGPGGSFPRSDSYPCSCSAPRDMAVGDFNGDADPDLAVAATDDVYVFPGTPTGSLQTPIHFASDGEHRSVAVGDFNRDSRLDLVVADASGFVSVLLNQPPSRVPPETNIESGPAGLTGDLTPTFEFSSDTGSTFECRVDLGAYRECSSPFTTNTLADGRHSFAVRAIDLSGNVDPTPATRTFTVQGATRDGSSSPVENAVPPPVVGESVVVEPLSGQVQVAMPRKAARAADAVPGLNGKTFIALGRKRRIPVGSIVDTRRGRARLTSARDRSGKRQQESSPRVSSKCSSRRGHGPRALPSCA